MKLVDGLETLDDFEIGKPGQSCHKRCKNAAFLGMMTKSEGVFDKTTSAFRS